MLSKTQDDDQEALSAQMELHRHVPDALSADYTARFDHVAYGNLSDVALAHHVANVRLLDCHVVQTVRLAALIQCDGYLPYPTPRGPLGHLAVCHDDVHRAWLVWKRPVHLLRPISIRWTWRAVLFSAADTPSATRMPVLGVLTVEGALGSDRRLCSLEQPVVGWRTATVVVGSGAEEAVAPPGLFPGKAEESPMQRAGGR